MKLQHKIIWEDRENDERWPGKTPTPRGPGKSRKEDLRKGKRQDENQKKVATTKPKQEISKAGSIVNTVQ